MEGFLDEALKLKEQIGRDFTFEEYRNLLFNSKEGAEYIFEHLDEIFEAYEDFIQCLITYEIYYDNNVYFNGLTLELERCIDKYLTLRVNEPIGLVFYGTTCVQKFLEKKAFCIDEKYLEYLRKNLRISEYECYDA